MRKTLHKCCGRQQVKLTVSINHIEVATIIGIWCIRLLDSAALVWPPTGGWSGTWPRKASKWVLNLSTCWLSKFLRGAGRRLNIFAPFTQKDASLACLTAAGELHPTVCRTIVLPLLVWLEKVTLYPLTSPCFTFSGLASSHANPYLLFSKSFEIQACYLDWYYSFPADIQVVQLYDELRE